MGFRTHRRGSTLGALLGAIGTFVLTCGAPAQSRGPVRAEQPWMLSDLTIDMFQTRRTQQIFGGSETSVWSYGGTMVSGPPGSLVPVAGSFLGPTIHAWKGQRVSINMTNLLGEESVTHWHGLDVPAEMDGHPMDQYASGLTYAYSFPILNRAGTYWYHPHPDMTTADQVQRGLAGFFIVHDWQEAALKLPSGAYDVPVCIQDRTFDPSNQFVYNPNMMNGFFGTTMLVNGVPNYVHQTATRVHRLRLLNGSTSRIYKLAFSDGTPMVVIGNDGGLLEAPRTYPYVMLSPGERAEVWADFRSKPVGSNVTLRSLSFSGAGLNQGTPLDIMTFSIARSEAETKVLPARLSTITRYRLEDAVNVANPKIYAIGMGVVNGQMVFTLNGDVFSMMEVSPNEVARCGELEVIQVTNTTAALLIAHPMHFHGRQFQILDRAVVPARLPGWNTVKDGFVDAGWKDTFMIMPGETVRILVRHGGYPGLFLYHCHNLVHESMGMMRNFRLDP